MPSVGAQPQRIAPDRPDADFFSSPEKLNVALGLVLVLVSIAVYNPAGHHPFTNYDDNRYVTENIHVKSGMRWDTVAWALTSDDESNWHPLTWLSHALDCQIFQLNPAGHHYTNILLHAANVGLLFWFLLRTTGSAGPSFMVAALFALHPVNVESVAWISERKNLLSMLFFLLALHAYASYLHRPNWRRYSLVALTFALGSMCKPQVITLPFVLLLWDYWPLRRMFPQGQESTGTPTTAESAPTFSWLVREKIPLFVITATSAVVTMWAQRSGDALGSLTKYSLPIRMENAVVAYVRYVSKAIWPSHLAVMYPHPLGTLSPLLVSASALVLVVVTILAIRLRRKRYFIVGWLWFLGTLVPMIGVVQVGSQAMADRYAYLPFIGLFVATCWGIADWASQTKFSGWYLRGACALALVSLALVTYRQLGYWSNNLSLWSHTLEVTGDNFAAEDGFGGALLEVGQYDEAMAHFRRAVAIRPSDPLGNLSVALDEQQHGQLREAIMRYQQVTSLIKDGRIRANAFTNMGYAYSQMGDHVGARRSFEWAVKERPRNVRAWLGLGLVAQRTGDLDTAVHAYSQLTAIEPSDVGYLLLAGALERSGHRSEAQKANETARQWSENLENARKIADKLLVQ